MEEKIDIKIFAIEYKDIEKYFTKSEYKTKDLAKLYHDDEAKLFEKTDENTKNKGTYLIFIPDEKGNVVIECVKDGEKLFNLGSGAVPKRTFKASLVKQKKEKKKGLGRLSGLLRKGSRRGSESDSGDGSRSGSTSSRKSTVSQANADDSDRMAQIAAQAAAKAGARGRKHYAKARAATPAASAETQAQEEQYVDMSGVKTPPQAQAQGEDNYYGTPKNTPVYTTMSLSEGHSAPRQSQPLYDDVIDHPDFETLLRFALMSSENAAEPRKKFFKIVIEDIESRLKEAGENEKKISELLEFIGIERENFNGLQSHIESFAKEKNIEIHSETRAAAAPAAPAAAPEQNYMPMSSPQGSQVASAGEAHEYDYVTHTHLREGSGAMGGDRPKPRQAAPLPEGARPPAPLPPGARAASEGHYATASAIVRVENPEIELELRSEHFSQRKQEMWNYLEGEIENLRAANVWALDEEKFIPLQGRFNKKFNTNIDNPLAFDAMSLEDFFRDLEVKNALCSDIVQERQSKLVSKEQKEIIAILQKNPQILEEDFEQGETTVNAKNIAQIVQDFGLDYSKINDPNDPQYQSIIDRIKFEVEKQVLLDEKKEAYIKLFELELNELIEKSELVKEQEALKARYGIDFEVDLNSYYSEEGQFTEAQEIIQGHLCDVLASNEIDKKYKPKENIYDMPEVGPEPTYGELPGMMEGQGSEALYGDATDLPQEPTYDTPTAYPDGEIYDNLEGIKIPDFKSIASSYWEQINESADLKIEAKRKALINKVVSDFYGNIDTFSEEQIKKFYNLPDDISPADLKNFESHKEVMDKFTAHIDKELSKNIKGFAKAPSAAREQEPFYIPMGPEFAKKTPPPRAPKQASAASEVEAGKGPISPEVLKNAKAALSHANVTPASVGSAKTAPRSGPPKSPAEVKAEALAAAAATKPKPPVKPRSLESKISSTDKFIERYESKIESINKAFDGAIDDNAISSLEEQLMVLYLEQEKLFRKNAALLDGDERALGYLDKASKVREEFYENYINSYISTDTEKAAMVSAYSDKREEKEIQESILIHKAEREAIISDTITSADKPLDRIEEIVAIDHKMQAELLSLESKYPKSAVEFVSANGLEHQSAKAKAYAGSIPKVLKEEKSINPAVKDEMERLIHGMRTYLGEELYYDNVAPSTISEEFAQKFGIKISEDEFRAAKNDVEKFLSSKVFLDSLEKKAGENIEKSSEKELSNLLGALITSPEDGKYQYLDQIASKYMLLDIPLDELANYNGESSPIHKHLKERVAYAAISRDSQKKESYKMWDELFKEIYSAMDVQDSKAREGLLDEIDFKYKLGMTTFEIEEMVSNSKVSERIRQRAYDSIKTTCQIEAEKSMPKFENSTSDLWKGDITKNQRQALVTGLIAKVKNVSQMVHSINETNLIEAERKILNQVSNAARILKSRGASAKELQELNRNINIERVKINTKAEIDRENIIEVDQQLIDLKDPSELSPQEAAVRSKRLIEEAQKRAAEGAKKRASQKKKGPPVAPKPKRTK